RKAARRNDHHLGALPSHAKIYWRAIFEALGLARTWLEAAPLVLTYRDLDAIASRCCGAQGRAGARRWCRRVLRSRQSDLLLCPFCSVSQSLCKRTIIAGAGRGRGNREYVDKVTHRCHRPLITVLDLSGETLGQCPNCFCQNSLEFVADLFLTVLPRL